MEISNRHRNAIPVFQKCRKVTRFWQFLSNHSSKSLAIFCVSNVLLCIDRNRQAKIGRFQIGSLTNFLCGTFDTLRTVLKIRILPRNFYFSVLKRCFNCSVRRFNNIIQGTCDFSIITFDVITLRSMRSSTQVYVYKRKSRVNVSIYIGKGWKM